MRIFSVGAAGYLYRSNYENIGCRHRVDAWKCGNHIFNEVWTIHNYYMSDLLYIRNENGEYMYSTSYPFPPGFFPSQVLTWGKGNPVRQGTWRIFDVPALRTSKDMATIATDQTDTYCEP